VEHFYATLQNRADRAYALTQAGKPAFSFSPSSGLSSARVMDPASPKQIPLKGAVLQKENAAFRWVQGRNSQRGEVSLLGQRVYPCASNSWKSIQKRRGMPPFRLLQGCWGVSRRESRV
jgi:hypothetical protein